MRVELWKMRVFWGWEARRWLLRRGFESVVLLALWRNMRGENRILGGVRYGLVIGMGKATLRCQDRSFVVRKLFRRSSLFLRQQLQLASLANQLYRSD